MDTKKTLILLCFLLTISPAYAWGEATHECIVNQALSNPALANSPIAQLIKSNRGCFDSGFASTDMTIIYYYTNGGQNYLATHTWAYSDKMMSLASNDCEKAFAYGIEAHLIADSISHNYMVPHAITSFPYLPNTPIHMVTEGAYEGYIMSQSPECYYQVQHSLDTLQNDPQLMTKVQQAVDSDGGNFNVSQEVGVLANALGSPDGFYSKLFNIPGIYSIVVDALRYVYPVQTIQPYYDQALAETVRIFQPQYHDERYNYDPSGFRALANADSQVMWIWAIVGILAAILIAAVVYKHYK